MNIREKREAYRFARRAWILASGNKQQAESQLREHCREVGMSPAMIILFVRLAVMLFEFWLSRGIKSPNPQPTEYDLSVGEDL